MIEPGRELDARVAEVVMGARWEHREDWPGGPVDIMRSPHNPNSIWAERKNGLEIHSSGMLSYSTDIEHAWEVVEKMQADGWGWTADSSAQEASPPEYFWRFHRGRLFVRGEATTAPLAICVAALRAYGEDV